MKKVAYVLLPLILVVLSFSVFIPHTQARSMHKALPSAFTYEGESKQEWPGNVYGAQTKIWFDNPGLSQTYEEEWDRYLEVATSNWSVILAIGLDKCSSSGNCTYCGIGYSSQTLYFFVFNSAYGVYCTQVPSDDKNQNITLQIFNNIYDDHVYWNVSASDLSCVGNPCRFMNISPLVWDHIQLDENWNSNQGPQNRVWGGNWTQNMWMDTINSQFHYQTIQGIMRAGPADPPQMGWNACNGTWCYFPNNTNQGGSMASCVYASGTNCNWRSF